jgi:transcriptional regulator with XRE-family HTH domain
MSELNTARLRLARERKGLQQIEISRLIGVAEGLAGQWERGLKEPSLGKLKALAKLLEVRIDWLLGEDEMVSDDLGAYVRTCHAPYASRQAILRDYNAPAGLRDLATDATLVAALRVEEHEWLALGSIDFGDGLTKDGYTAALMIMRTCSVEARRRELEGKRGRNVAPLGTRAAG